MSETDRRAEIIKEIMTTLNKYEGSEDKPIDREVYWLVHNIAKWILAYSGKEAPLEFAHKTRGKRYTSNETFLICLLIKNKVDAQLWNGDVISVDRSENLLTDIRNEYGETVLSIFNHIEGERIMAKLCELKE